VAVALLGVPGLRPVALPDCPFSNAIAIGVCQIELPTVANCCFLQ